MLERPTLALGAILAAGCATWRPTEEEPCCVATAQAAAPLEPQPVAAPLAPPDAAPLVAPGDGQDFASRVAGPARCAEAAAQLLARDPEQAWRALGRCVDAGHFTALDELLSGPWDRELKTRGDAPELVARVVAMRGGDVERDVPLLHERRIPLFSLSQALARPDLFRGTLVIVRARLSPAGLLDEMRLVGALREAEVAPEERFASRDGVRYFESSARLVARLPANLDVRTGQRALLPDGYPFVDPDDVVVVLARFEGLRATDAWPMLSVLAHFRPSPLLSY